MWTHTNDVSTAQNDPLAATGCAESAFCPCTRLPAVGSPRGCEQRHLAARSLARSLVGRLPSSRSGSPFQTEACPKVGSKVQGRGAVVAAPDVTLDQRPRCGARVSSLSLLWAMVPERPTSLVLLRSAQVCRVPGSLWEGGPSPDPATALHVTLAGHSAAAQCDT